MASEKTMALVLKVVEFSESSSVLTLFTRDFGKVRGLAKGARRPKGPFEAALDVLSLCRIVLLRKSSDALDLLTEAKLERRFRPLAGDLSSLYAAYYVAELLDDLTDEGDPHPELFDVANDTLAALGGGGAALLLLRFEMRALSLLGHSPSCKQCVECGQPVAGEGRIGFSPLAGGVLCDRCRAGARGVIAVRASVIAALANLATGDTSANAPEELRELYGELRAVLNRYWSHLLGHEPKMYRYLGSLTV